jgi:competence protein ComFC
MWKSVASHLRSFLDGGLGLFYPNVCQICGEERATPAEGYVGPKCWNQVRFITPPFCSRCGLPAEGEITNAFVCSNCEALQLNFRNAQAAVLANSFMLQVIHRYKYGRALYFEPFLADLLQRQAKPVLQMEKWDFIVPVPLHPVKEREREFNQAERLALHLSRATNIPINKHLVERIEATSTQTALTRKERIANMKGAFAPKKGVKLSGQRIVLLDDVMTTGSTTSACAEALHKAGAGDICVWAVARGV